LRSCIKQRNCQMALAKPPGLRWVICRKTHSNHSKHLTCNQDHTSLEKQYIDPDSLVSSKSYKYAIGNIKVEILKM
jgi:hypothetical protein